MKHSRTLAALLPAALLFITLAGCERHEGPAERAGEKIDKGMDKAADAADHASDEMKDTVHGR